jgi:hypothetical protein
MNSLEDEQVNILTLISVIGGMIICLLIGRGIYELFKFLIS